MNPNPHAQILVADDDDDLRFLIAEIMRKEGYAIDQATDGAKACELAAAHPYDLIILDIRMPKRNGLDALREIRKQRPDAVVVMITAHGTQEVALEAIKAGAYDYFTKPFELPEFRIVVRRALEKRRLETELLRLQAQLDARHSYGKIVGRSKEMAVVYDLIDHVAPNDVTVLIRGESGTGKELVAREIHRRSPRQEGPFVSINCAAIPDALLESELFGHERGAFTGAFAAKPGRFEIANNGTVFLDEIGDMPLALQAKLLRVLQEREIERVGGTRQLKVDIRVLAATNQDLELAVANQTFREDLFFRLNVIPIQLPPLRERIDDIAPLTQHFLARFNAEFGKRLLGVEDDVLKCFVKYHWAGNIREMENVIQRAVILASGDTIGVSDLPEALQAVMAPQPGGPGPAGGATLGGVSDDYLSDFSQPLAAKIAAMADVIERRAIQLALARTGGKREETADLLGLSRKSLYNKMQRLGLNGE